MVKHDLRDDHAALTDDQMSAPARGWRRRKRRRLSPSPVPRSVA